MSTGPGSGSHARRTDPTAAQRIRLACHLLVTAWPYLDDARDSSLARRAATGRLTASAARSLDDVIRLERGGRLSNERLGLVPLPASPVPASLAVVDAEQAARIALRDAAWVACSTLRSPDWGWPPPVVATPGDPCAFLARCAPHLGPVAAELARDLTAAAGTLLRVLGVDEEWAPLGQRCPACRRRSLRRCGPVVSCSGHAPRCLCSGESCGCGRDDRAKGSEHLWPLDGINRGSVAA